MSDVPNTTRVRNRRYPEVVGGIERNLKPAITGRSFPHHLRPGNDRSVEEHVVYDRVVLTIQQLRDWTGEDFGDE